MVDATEVIGSIASLVPGAFTIVDVGAQTLDTECHIYHPLYECAIPLRVVGFEPLPQEAASRRNEEKGRQTEIIEAFVGTGEEQTFYENDPSGASSLLPLNTEVCSRFASLVGLHTISRRMVQTAALDILLTDVQDIDFLKLDIQGFELAALRGASAVLSRTAFVQCETEFVPVYQDQPLFSEVEIYMRSHRFDFLDFYAPAYRAPVVPSRRIRNDQLVWADALFVVRPEAASDRALLVQAIVNLAIYKKLSIAERALAAYDARHRTQLSRLIATLG